MTMTLRERLEPYRILNVAKDGMIEGFNAALHERGIVADPAQLEAAMRLQRFYDELIAFKAARRNRLRKLLLHPTLPRGVWFWGGVGRGKTFLMDCFFAAVPYRRKRRVHFHAFMREVHESLREFRHEADPLARVAARIVAETRLMCFDEFHVADIADAMILGRLMQALFEGGVLFCITSNHAPEDLYQDGLQRELFLPTIALLEQQLDVCEVDSGVDYRLRDLAHRHVYFCPDDAAAAEEMLQVFRRLCGGEGHRRTIRLLGREVPVLRRAPGVAWFDFATLCEGHRSQHDYLDLAYQFHTLFLSGVPRFGAEQADAARRFTWLVDVLYDHRVKLVMSAAAPAEALGAGLAADRGFARTASRLVEMRSREYLSWPHRRYERRSAAAGQAA